MYHINPDQRSVESKNRLYLALSEMMSKKNFQSITIMEVVKSAQMARSTFYRNFDTLEDILLWKCDDAFHDLLHKILESTSTRTAQTGTERFPFILPFFRYWYADSEIIELLVAANRLDVIFAAFEDTMKKLVLRFPPALMNRSPYLDYFLAFRSGAVIRILLQWIKNEKNITPEDMYRFFEGQSEGLRLHT